MTVVTAIDPGTRESAWVRYDLRLHRPIDFALEPNIDVLERLRTYPIDDTYVIEQIEGRGMPVGSDVFETIRWAGRFEEACYPNDVILMKRRTVKLRLCGTSAAGDKNVRVALMDRWGGESVAKGKKAKPGPLYGMRADLWAALAIAVAYEIGED